MKTTISKRIPNFNRTIFILFIGILTLLTFVTLIAAAAEEEGTNGDSQIGFLLARIFYVLRFPTHTLLGPIVGIGGFLTFFAGLIINCIFWALIIERLIYILRNRQTILRLKSADRKKSSS
jgi:hypothetical protein